MQSENKILESFKSMVIAQHKLNDLIMLDWHWKLDLLQIYTAMFTETAEFIDTQNWKWWKKGKVCEPYEAKMELVDIYHFLITFLLKAYFYDDKNFHEDTVPQLLSDAFSNTEKSKNNIYDLFSMGTSFVGYLTALVSAEDYQKGIIKSSDIPINVKFLITAIEEFMSVIHSFFIDLEDFEKTFFTKLILNELRSENGYKQGSYNSAIFTLDDNKFMSEVQATIKFVTLDQYKVELKDYYNDYIKEMNNKITKFNNVVSA